MSHERYCGCAACQSALNRRMELKRKELEFKKRIRLWLSSGESWTTEKEHKSWGASLPTAAEVSANQSNIIDANQALRDEGLKEGLTSLMDIPSYPAVRDGKIVTDF
jgi:hypothetical protein